MAVAAPTLPFWQGQPRGPKSLYSNDLRAPLFYGFPRLTLDARPSPYYYTHMSNEEKDKQFDAWVKQQEAVAEVQSMIDAIFGKYK